jgi:hypothetical protein
LASRCVDSRGMKYTIHSNLIAFALLVVVALAVIVK